MRNAWFVCIVLVVFGITASWAQAPGVGDSENAILREQVALLKKALADKQKEVDALKVRLAALEGQFVPTTLGGFFRAVRDNNLPVVRAGLALNPHWLDIQQDGAFFPLATAAIEGRKEMVELLLSRGAKVQQKNATGEIIPVRTRDPEIATILQEHGAPVAGPDPGIDLGELLKRYEKDLKDMR